MTGKVIDSSALAVFLLKERGWEKIRAILYERPYTLELAIMEVANSIWKRASLLRDIDEEKALTLLNDLIEIKITALKIEPQDKYLPKALKIALQHKITLYDSLFITQALTKKATLITSDKEQSSIASKLKINTSLI